MNEMNFEHLFHDQRLGKEWGEEEGSEEAVEKRDVIDNKLEKKHKKVPKKGNVGRSERSEGSVGE